MKPNGISCWMGHVAVADVLDAITYDIDPKKGHVLILTPHGRAIGSPAPEWRRQHMEDIWF